MTSGLYVAIINRSTSEGYFSKILGQARALALGFDQFFLICFDGRDVVRYRIVFGELKESARVPVRTTGTRNLVLLAVSRHLIRRIHPELVYHRYPRVDPIYLAYLVYARARCRSIFHEVPTYPYDREFARSLMGRIKKLIDRTSRTFLRFCVDAVALVGANNSRVFGVKTIPIQNGVDTSVIPRLTQVPSSNHVSLLFVGNLTVWHGIDRLFRGLALASPNLRELFSVQLVSPFSPEARHLVELARQLGIEQQVTFCGPAFGTELSTYYGRSQLCIGTLGFHRQGVESANVLKVREYCLNGRAFFYSGRDSALENFHWALQVPADDTPIDVEQIVNLRNRVLHEPNVEVKVQQFALENFSWERQMKPILDACRQEPSQKFRTRS